MNEPASGTVQAVEDDTARADALCLLLISRGLGTATYPCGEAFLAAVDAVKHGAFDFFEKPFNDNGLVDRVMQALLDSRDRLQHEGSASRIRSRLERLTARERDVMDLILQGKLNKIIAGIEEALAAG